jgi:acetyl esterase/lipase
VTHVRSIRRSGSRSGAVASPEGLRLTIALLLLGAAACDRAREGAGGPAARISTGASHTAILDRTYVTVAGRDLRLDLYVPRGERRPTPTLLYLHGGGWTQGTKDEAADLVPASAGWAVISPDYRLAPTDLAPAAVEDAVCALRWVAAHADERGLDLRRLVVAGYSAGGHLALMLALLPDSASFGDNCPGVTTPRPAAVLNLAGITDVGELLRGATRREWAVTWIGDRLDRQRIVSRVSPLTWVRAGVPPVVTVHGEADAVVPYEQALRLHLALDRAGVASSLCTIPEGSHDLLGSTQAVHAMVAMMALMSRGDVSLDTTALHAAC